MLRLHDNASSGNGYKVRLLLTQLGSQFQRIEYDIDRGETRTPEFLAKNPNGRVPVLEIEDGRSCPSRTPSCATWPKARRSSPARPTRPGAGSGRRCCSGCSSSSTATSPTSPWPAPGSRTSRDDARARERPRPGSGSGVSRRSAVMEEHLRARRLLRRRTLLDRRHRPLRLHPRRARRRLRPGAVPRAPRLADTRGGAARIHRHHRLARPGGRERGITVAHS